MRDRDASTLAARGREEAHDGADACEAVGGVFRSSLGISLKGSLRDVPPLSPRFLIDIFITVDVENGRPTARSCQPPSGYD